MPITWLVAELILLLAWISLISIYFSECKMYIFISFLHPSAFASLYSSPIISHSSLSLLCTNKLEVAFFLVTIFPLYPTLNTVMKTHSWLAHCKKWKQIHGQYHIRYFISLHHARKKQEASWVLGIHKKLSFFMKK